MEGCAEDHDHKPKLLLLQVELLLILKVELLLSVKFGAGCEVRDCRHHSCWYVNLQFFLLGFQRGLTLVNVQAIVVIEHMYGLLLLCQLAPRPEAVESLDLLLNALPLTILSVRLNYHIVFVSLHRYLINRLAGWLVSVP